MALTKIDDRGLNTPIDLLDNEKIRFGTTDNALQIYHDGSGSIIYDNGTGPLNIQTNNSNINIKGGGSAAHDMAIFKSTEGVELYHNNEKRFETTGTGILATGPDSGAQLTITGIGTNAFGLINFDGPGTGGGNIKIEGEDAIQLIKDGGVKLYYDGGGPKLETTASGVDIDGKLFVGKTALDDFASSLQYNAGVSGSFICLGRNDTTVADGNGIGGLRFFSNDTSINSGNYLRVGEITCAADGDFLSGDAPTKMTFSTMTDGTTTLETRMTIDSSGNVGIGTDSPSGASGKILEINGGDDQARLVLKNDTTGSASTDGHQIYSSGNILGIQNREDSDIVFETGGSERLRVANDGRVYFGDYLDPATRAYIHSDGNDPWPLTISASSSDSVDRAIVFRLRPGHKAAEFDTDGHLKFPAGHGINFSNYGSEEDPDVAATDVTGNLLDDYETGKWVPTADSGCDGLTYTAANCVYTKIGKQVTLYGKVKNFTNVNSNTLSLGGLPFVAVDHAVGSCMVHSFNVSTARTNDRAQLNTFLLGSSVQLIRFYLSGIDGDDNWTAITGTNATSNGDMYFTASYWVA